ncbi:MAG: FAD-dependent oxidoreductase [candidate division WOR-3 bacterium]|nr:MAG: FAD-dependent oxidoreductase [candidate division WOR-3 bacterium]
MRRAQLVVVGGGPAGLSAAAVAAGLGAEVMLVDDNETLGGQLIKQTHKFFGDKGHYCGVRGVDIATILSERAGEHSVTVLSATSVVGLYPGKVLGLANGDSFRKLGFESLVIATGAAENSIPFPGNDLPGVYGAGAVQTLMNVYGVRPGRRVLMVGSGNIGVIVSYQLLQAGIDVAAVVEALPAVGGYHVHAAKLVRLGVPILTSHTVKAALGAESVTGAVICRVDGRFRPVAGTDRRLKVDTICVAVGLTPLAELLWQAGCRMFHVPELGGHVAWHDEYMETSQPGIFVAGDVSGIEEASTAMLEGRVAGARAWERLNRRTRESRDIIDSARLELGSIRKGPFGEKATCGKQRLAECVPA